MPNKKTNAQVLRELKKIDEQYTKENPRKEGLFTDNFRKFLNQVLSEELPDNYINIKLNEQLRGV